MRRADAQARVMVELAEAATGAVLSSRRHDGPWGAMFDAQDESVAQIVRTLAPRVRDEELRRIRAKRPESLQAYDLVLQARDQIYRLDRASFERSEDLLARAISLDPRYAAAHALMAEFLSLRYGQSWSADPAKDGAEVMRFARDAIDLDPNDTRALACLAHNKAFFWRDTRAALPLFERALDVSPSNASAWMWSSVTHAYIDDGAEAVRRGELALRLSPRDWFGFQFNTALCLAHYTRGDYEVAVRYGLDALAENPRYHSALRYTIASLAASSDLAKARTMAGDLLALEPGFRVGPLLASHPFQDAARRDQYGRFLCAAGLPP
jgi:adenylate cyclase